MNKLRLSIIKPWYLLFIALLLPMLLAQAEQATNWQESAKSFISRACKIEFDLFGEEERRDYSFMSDEYQKRQWKNGNESSGEVIQWTWDPIVIVKSFEVIGVEMKKSKVFATVKFLNVGRSKGKGAIEMELENLEVVEYELIASKNGWKIVDPPPPRVSKKALYALYERLVNENEQLNKERTTPMSSSQRQNFEKQIYNMRILSGD